MVDPRQWIFVTDMNHSGAATISDVWLWFKWLFFYPGDMFIHSFIKDYPGIAQFFEVTYDDYGGVISGMVSVVAWSVFAAFVYAMGVVLVALPKYLYDNWPVSSLVALSSGQLP